MCAFTQEIEFLHVLYFREFTQWTHWPRPADSIPPEHDGNSKRKSVSQNQGSSSQQHLGNLHTNTHTRTHAHTQRRGAMFSKYVIYGLPVRPELRPIRFPFVFSTNTLYTHCLVLVVSRNSLMCDLVVIITNNNDNKTCKTNKTHTI